MTSVWIWYIHALVDWASCYGCFFFWKEIHSPNNMLIRSKICFTTVVKLLTSQKLNYNLKGGEDCASGSIVLLCAVGKLNELSAMKSPYEILQNYLTQWSSCKLLVGLLFLRKIGKTEGSIGIKWPTVLYLARKHSPKRLKQFHIRETLLSPGQPSDTPWGASESYPC